MIRSVPCVRLAVPVAVCLALSCSAAGEPGSADAGAGVPRLGSSFAVAPAEPEAPAELLAHAGAILYLNRGGGTYTPGFNDSRTDRSSLIAETSQIPAWDVGDDEWSEVVACVSELFADYRIEVTDRNPGSVAHTEAIIGGHHTDLRTTAVIRGEPEALAGGIAPFKADCTPLESAIVFVFAEEFDGDLRRVCEVAAQEVAHAYGLDHAYLCEDAMSYLVGCGAKSFRDEHARCGELEARPCAGPGYDCQRDTQNSAELLAQRIGRVDAPEGRVSGACSAGGSAGLGGLVGIGLALIGLGRRHSCRGPSRSPAVVEAAPSSPLPRPSPRAGRPGRQGRCDRGGRRRARSGAARP